jgi:hypothetical protein
MKKHSHKNPSCSEKMSANLCADVPRTTHQ